MTPAELSAILRSYNLWRRGNLDGLPQPDPREIGEAIDAAVEMIERLEAAERAWKISDQTVYDLTEKVIPNIREKLEAAEKERDALQTKIADMEKQEPVAEWVDGAFDQYPHLRWKEPYKAIVGAKLYTKFYALPGVKGE